MKSWSSSICVAFCVAFAGLALAACDAESPATPSIESFTAEPAVVSAGDTTVLTAVFSGGTATIEPDLGGVSSGEPITTGALTETTTFTLTVTGADGTAVTATAEVQAVDEPRIESFSAAEALVPTGESTDLTAVFSGGDAKIDHGVGAVDSGVAVSTGPLSAETTYTLTVTNAAGATATAETQVQVTDQPTITSFAASRTIVTAGDSVDLSFTFINGAGSIDSGVGSVTSGEDVTVGPLTATTTYTLTVTGALGTDTRSVTVTVVPPPSIASFTAAPESITAGDPIELSATFAGGVGVVTPGDLAITSGVPFAPAELNETTLFTLTVTNAAGASASDEVQVLVYPQPSISAFTATPSPAPYGSTVQLAAVFTGGAGSIDPDIGAVTSGEPVTSGALLADTTFTLTVENPLGITTTHDLAVSVYDVDECADPSLNDCDDNATCTNANPGFYDCACNVGYQDAGGGDGRSCSRVPCDPLSAPDDGSIDVPASPAYGDTAHYACNDGYTLEGDPERTCLETGEWSGAPVTCQIVSCGEPPAVDHAGVAYTSTTYMSTATYTCDTGYLLASAHDQLTCAASAVWEPSTPVSCRDADECAGEGDGNTCPASVGECLNEPGGYVCDCSSSTDPDYCGGACDQSCSSNHMQTRTCTAGTCDGTCDDGFYDCNGDKLGDGCESSVADDVLNCGGCGAACPLAELGVGSTCEQGRCVFHPTTDVEIPSGVYSFDEIIIPDGVTVTLAAANLTSVLELNASGDVTIDGTIDLSGGAASGGPSGQGGTTGRPTGTGGGGGKGAAGGNGSGGTGGRFGGGRSSGGSAEGGGGGGGYAGGGGGGGGSSFYGAAGNGGSYGGSQGGHGGGYGNSGGTGGKGGVAPGAYAGRSGASSSNGVCGCSGGGGGGGSIGAVAAADLAVASTFYPGSGGGAGGTAGYVSRRRGSGGGGGGALRISSPASITVGPAGALLANGGDGASGGGVGGGGGGGSGGVIYLDSPVLTVLGTVEARGGSGGDGGDAASGGDGGDGGDGGLGRIRISATQATCTLSGSFDPPLVSGCDVAAEPESVYVGAWGLSSMSFSATTDLAIPAEGTPTVTATVDVSGAGAFLWDVDVTTFLTHSYASDIEITLTSPAGTVVTLTSNNGGKYDDLFDGTVWDDDANPAGQVPYDNNDTMVTDRAYSVDGAISRLVPEEPLGAFFGEDPNGTWILTVADVANYDGGHLAGFDLTLTTPTDMPSSQSETYTSPDGDVAIPDQSVVSSTLSVPSDPMGSSVCKVSAFTDFGGHPGGLYVTLMSPSGTVVTLTSGNGGDHSNVFAGTTWDDGAAPGNQVPYVSAAGQVTDTVYATDSVETLLTPEEGLASFRDELAAGTWTLTIADEDAGGGNPVLHEWSVTIDRCSR